MSQEDQILSHLKRRSITQLQALNNYGCMRLAARIERLRGRGHKIKTKFIRTHNNRSYARYSLEKL